MEFASNDKSLAIRALVEDLRRHVIYDEEPIFISDEATLLDVSSTSVDTILRRCASYYGVHLTPDDLRTPLVALLPRLEQQRAASMFCVKRFKDVLDRF